MKTKFTFLPIPRLARLIVSSAAAVFVSAVPVHAGAPDKESAEFLGWFKQTAVCMRRAADLEIRRMTLDKKDLTSERNLLEVTDFTRMMCGGGLRTFLTKQAGYSIPDADALLDDLAERMVKTRIGNK